MSDDPVRLLIVDDHALVRDGLRARLAASPGLRVVAEAADADAALGAAAREALDLVIMDVSLRGASGIEAAARLRAAHPGLRVLMLSMHDKPEYLHEALRAGATGYVLKDGESEEIVQAIAAVMRGETFIAPALRAHPPPADLPGRASARGMPALTPREREVLALIAEGLSSREIGQRLAMGVRTVETHRTALRRKLGLASHAALVRFAVEQRRPGPAG